MRGKCSSGSLCLLCHLIYHRLLPAFAKLYHVCQLVVGFIMLVKAFSVCLRKHVNPVARKHFGTSICTCGPQPCFACVAAMRCSICQVEGHNRRSCIALADAREKVRTAEKVVFHLEQRIALAAEKARVKARKKAAESHHDQEVANDIVVTRTVHDRGTHVSFVQNTNEDTDDEEIYNPDDVVPVPWELIQLPHKPE